MFLKLLTLFILIPFIELAILIKIGTLIGFWPTILSVVVTGFFGAVLARQQGFLILEKIRVETQSGRVPARELIDGLLILIGGVVLLTPGFITDIVGFMLLIPVTRKYFRLYARKKLEGRVKRTGFQTTITIE